MVKPVMQVPAFEGGESKGPSGLFALEIVPGFSPTYAM